MRNLVLQIVSTYAYLLFIKKKTTAAITAKMTTAPITPPTTAPTSAHEKHGHSTEIISNKIESNLKFSITVKTQT